MWHTLWPENKADKLVVVAAVGHVVAAAAAAAQMVLGSRHKSRLETLAKNVKIFCNKDGRQLKRLLPLPQPLALLLLPLSLQTSEKEREGERENRQLLEPSQGTLPQEKLLCKMFYMLR